MNEEFFLQSITSRCELNHKPMLVWMVELLVSPLPAEPRLHSGRSSGRCCGRSNLKLISSCHRKSQACRRVKWSAEAKLFVLYLPDTATMCPAVATKILHYEFPPGSTRASRIGVHFLISASPFPDAVREIRSYPQLQGAYVPRGGIYFARRELCARRTPP